jgi:hypothetical protein
MHRTNVLTELAIPQVIGRPALIVQEHNDAIVDQIDALIDQFIDDGEPIKLPELTVAEKARDCLDFGGYYPTARGLELIQDPEDQEAARRGIVEDLEQLAAVAMLVSSLAWRGDD